MRYTNIPSAQTVIDHCKNRGIENIVISPGSRNAPLIIGFTEDPFFKCFSIVDERCAGFFAIGIAQQTSQPVALVCTSGSALLNYYPSVAEAFYSDIPLIVISADRPADKIDIGDGQTIRQEGVLEKHVACSANLRQDMIPLIRDNGVHASPGRSEGAVGEVIQAGVQRYNNDLLNHAFNTAIQSKCPVHINIPLEEPLYGTRDTVSVEAEVKPPVPQRDEPLSDPEGVSATWQSAERKMVLVGLSRPGTMEQEVVELLARDPSVIVFTETTSNLHHPSFFPSIDSIIAPIEKSGARDELFKKLQPDILLTFGGMVVSKKIKAFLRMYSPGHHWHVDPGKANDTFFCLEQHYKMNVNHFLKATYGDRQPRKSAYRHYWNGIKEHYCQRRRTYLEEIQFSDMLAFDRIIKSIPQGYLVHLSNSSTVRYSQLYDMDASLRVFCNRGTSGIDGSTSTAVGASIYAGSPTLLLSGDLSFLYDSNALWNNYLRADFRVIVINNKGGGIFRILPGKEDTENFETYFETVQDLPLEKLCSFFGISYNLARDSGELASALEGFYRKSDTPKLLEVRTPRVLNDKILLNYFDFIS